MRPDLDVLSDATRRLILALLTVEHELCVCELEAALDAPQPLVSRHLAILRSTAWLVARRDGRRVYYRLPDSLPSWGRRVVDAFAEGGVPAPELQTVLVRLHDFAGRPVRLERAAS